MTTRHNNLLPPGPEGRWFPTLRFVRDPKGSMDRWVGQYGDPFLMRALNGPVVVTGRPDLIRQIYSHDPMDYDIFAMKTVQPILGPGAMLLLSGQAHRRERKLVMPMFHGERMRAYSAAMRECARKGLAEVEEGQPFKMLDATTKISLEIIVQAIFGGEEQASISRLISCSQNLIKRSSPLLFFSRNLQFSFAGLSPWDRFAKAKAALRKAFDVELLRRKQTPRQREDILTLLLNSTYEDGTRIDPEHAYDELATFLFAGHETSAIAMAWAMYHLHDNPNILKTVQQELDRVGHDDLVDSAEELAKLPYLKAVAQETLRMNPVVTEVVRVLNRPMTLGDFQLEPGMAVAPAAALVHYRSDIFPEPQIFRPERFMERSYSSNEYMPFGGGHRRCAGAAFALHEMAIVLGTLLRNNRFELLEREKVVPKRRNVTMGPSTPIRMRLIKRV